MFGKYSNPGLNKHIVSLGSVCSKRPRARQCEVDIIVVQRNIVTIRYESKYYVCKYVAGDLPSVEEYAQSSSRANEE